LYPNANLGEKTGGSVTKIISPCIVTKNTQNNKNIKNKGERKMSKSKNVHLFEVTGGKKKKRKPAPLAREHARKKSSISFQACGNNGVKFCKPLPLTPALTKAFGREIWKIVPNLVKQTKESYPVLSVWHDKENGNLILRCDARSTKAHIVHDKNGVATYKVHLRTKQN